MIALGVSFEIDGSGWFYRFENETCRCAICGLKRNKIEMSLSPCLHQTKWVGIYPYTYPKDKDFQGCIYCQILHSEISITSSGVLRVCCSCIFNGTFDIKTNFYQCTGHHCIVGEKEKNQKKEELMCHIRQEEQEARKRFYWNSQIDSMRTFLLIGRFRKRESDLAKIPKDIIRMIAEKVGVI